MVVLDLIARYANDLWSIFILGSGITTWIALHFNFKNARANVVLKACLAAEKTIDSEAFTSDGQIDQAKLNFAVTLVKLAIPSADTAVVTQHITEYLTDVHAFLKDVPPSVINIVQPVDNNKIIPALLKKKGRKLNSVLSTITLTPSGSAG